MLLYVPVVGLAGMKPRKSACSQKKVCGGRRSDGGTALGGWVEWWGDRVWRSGGTVCSRHWTFMFQTEERACRWLLSESSALSKFKRKIFSSVWKIFSPYNFDSQLVKRIRDVLIHIFGKVRKNIFFDIFLGQAVCSILLGGRRSGFLLLGSFQLGIVQKIRQQEEG